LKLKKLVFERLAGEENSNNDRPEEEEEDPSSVLLPVREVIEERSLPVSLPVQEGEGLQPREEERSPPV
ncbi:hypothetical protein LDENG_00261550, partial [Lucifuga dentata]